MGPPHVYYWPWACAVLAVAGALCSDGFETAAASKQETISPPSNLTATLEDPFTVIWTWDAPKHRPDEGKCIPSYRSCINGDLRQSSEAFRRKTPDDLNKKVCIKVQSWCSDNEKSSWIENCTFLLKEDLQPPVKDFRCIWYEEEPMECTWRFGKETPPDTGYILFYKYEDRNAQCQAYTYGVVNGCKFINETFLKREKLYILITDSAKTLGHFYESVKPISILQPRPPNINVPMLSMDRINVEWNDSKWHKKVYEVQIKNSKSQNWSTYSVASANNFTHYSVDHDAKYTVRVRSIFNKYFGGELWSDWSTEETIGEHREQDWTQHNILLLTIPLIVAIATILLLVFLKRLRVLIYPPIPDPSKLFIRMFPDQSEERQNWIQYHSTLFLEKAAKEEICSVLLIEKETSPETQHG